MRIRKAHQSAEIIPMDTDSKQGLIVTGKNIMQSAAYSKAGSEDPIDRHPGPRPV